MHMHHVQHLSMRQLAVTGVGLGQTVAIFGSGAALLFATTHGLVPLLSRATGQEPILWWFLGGGLGVFLPLVLVAGLLLHREGAAFRRTTWHNRLRFRPLTARDWWWAAGALVVIGSGSAALMALLDALLGDVQSNPPFLRMAPLTPDRYWLLLVWLPFWVLNILGEEVLWRGVLLPRQEQRFGRWAWCINSAGWLLFHAAFGWPLVVTLLPILVVLPYVVQRRQNTWLGVVIHAGLNGPGFLAVAFGLL
jgi:membrane protease YdiL (CAAX protease family)